MSTHCANALPINRIPPLDIHTVEGGSVEVEIDQDIYDALADHATSQGMTLDELLEVMLRVVAV